MDSDRKIVAAWSAVIATTTTASVRAEYITDTCRGFTLYDGPISWMLLGAICCLLYPFAALYLIRRRVAREVTGIDAPAGAPRPGVFGWTAGLAVFSCVYWFLIVFSCMAYAGFRTPSAVLPYLAVVASLLSLHVWLASRQQLAWHRRHRRARV